MAFGPWAARLDEAATAGVALVTVAGLAAASGGDYPASWGWAALGLLWVGGLALVLRPRIEVGRLQLVQLAGIAGLTAWTLASTAWSVSAAQPVDETTRTLVYLAAAIACLGCRRGNGRFILLGVWLAIALVCLYSLGTRLLPDRLGLSNDSFAAGRLYAPIGYWNGLGIFATMGLLVGLGLASRGRSGVLRTAAAASLPVMAATLYFTFSRGAMLALAVGLVVAVAADPRRLQLDTIGDASNLRRRRIAR